MFGVRNIKFCESNSNLGRVLIDQHLMFPLVEPCGKGGALNEPVQLKMAQVNGNAFLCKHAYLVVLWIVDGGADRMVNLLGET